MPRATLIPATDGDMFLEGRIFVAPNQTATVTVETTLDHPTILYPLDGSFPGLDAAIYGGPIRLDSSAIVRAVAYDGRFSERAQSRPATINFVDEWALNLSTDGGGAILTFPRAQTQIESTLVSISPVPLAGWSFLRWEGDFAGMAQDVSLGMDGDQSAKAAFGANIEFVALGAGEVIVAPPQGLFEYGSVVHLEARPSNGSQFVLWGGAVSGREASMSLRVTNAAPIISALFLPSGQDPCYLHSSHEGPGALTVIPAMPFYLRGDTGILTATPAHEAWNVIVDFQAVAHSRFMGTMNPQCARVGVSDQACCRQLESVVFVGGVMHSLDRGCSQPPSLSMLAFSLSPFRLGRRRFCFLWLASWLRGLMLGP